MRVASMRIDVLGLVRFLSICGRLGSLNLAVLPRMLATGILACG
jgi:hypothetical protein